MDGVTIIDRFSGTVELTVSEGEDLWLSLEPYTASLLSRRQAVRLSRVLARWAESGQLSDDDQADAVEEPTHARD